MASNTPNTTGTIDPSPTPLPGPSPGNAFSSHSDTPPMRLPALEFLYRMECDIDPTEISVGAPHGSGAVRTIMPITGGVVRGPRIEAEVLSVGGADWAEGWAGTHSMRLSARYILRTPDNSHIMVDSRGLYRPGPGTAYSRWPDFSVAPPRVATQDDVEFFTHVSFQAGEGKYNWLNGLVCVGVLECVGERIVLDCYALTNFPGREAEDVMIKR